MILEECVTPPIYYNSDHLRWVWSKSWLTAVLPLWCHVITTCCTCTCTCTVATCTCISDDNIILVILISAVLVSGGRDGNIMMWDSRCAAKGLD